MAKSSSRSVSASSVKYILAAAASLLVLILLARTFSTPKMSNTPQSFVDGIIKSEKVVVFSKTYCPYCKRCKEALKSVLGNDFVVVELDERQDGDAIQDYLQQLTGARSVPRVFVKGKFVGGGDDTVAKVQSGEFKQLLG